MEMRRVPQAGSGAKETLRVFAGERARAEAIGVGTRAHGIGGVPEVVRDCREHVNAGGFRGMEIGRNGGAGAECARG